MSIDEIHVGNIGTSFILTIKDNNAIVDISSQTTLEVHFQKPDGTTLNKIGSLVTDGTDGKLKYVTIADDLDQVGAWFIQAFIVINTGEYKSNLGKFQVYGNII